MRLRVSSAIAALLFAWSAILQLNDPDPLLWFAIYLAAMGVAAAGALPKPPPVWAPGAMLAVCAARLAALAIQGLPEEPHPMKYGPQTGWLADEVVREGGGLLIVVGWMLVLLIASRRAEE